MVSQFLDDRLSSKNRAANLMVVFVDVVSYSKRRSQSQAAVIDAFMACLETARKATAKHFIEYTESNKVSFVDDVIYLPSGDGAAVCFPFDGLHDVHLHFSKELLKSVHEHNTNEGCEKFVEQGWCNCHSGFYLSVGISEGKGILYRDVNGGYNVAGNAINMAARVMGLADKSQIIFTEDAYRQIIDMVDDPHLDERFKEYENVNIKHNLKISVCQYVESGLDYLNTEAPKDLAFKMRAVEAMEGFKKLGFPVPDISDSLDKDKMMETLETMSKAFSRMVKPDNTISAEVIDRNTENKT